MEAEKTINTIRAAIHRKGRLDRSIKRVRVTPAAAIIMSSSSIPLKNSMETLVFFGIILIFYPLCFYLD